MKTSGENTTSFHLNKRTVDIALIMAKSDRRKISIVWEKHQIKTLIEELESRPGLWDPSQSKYMNRFELFDIDARYWSLIIW